jgi:hypothetical protein
MWDSVRTLLLNKQVVDAFRVTLKDGIRPEAAVWYKTVIARRLKDNRAIIRTLRRTPWSAPQSRSST